MKKIKKKISIIFFIFLFLLSFTSSAQTPENTVSANNITSFETSELIDKLEDFQRNELSIQQQIAGWSSFDESMASIDPIAKSYKNLSDLFKQKKSLSSWNLKKAIDLKTVAKPLLEKSDTFKEIYVKFLEQTETLLKELKNTRADFKNYAHELAKDPSLSAQSEAFSAEFQKIESYIFQIKKKRSAIMASYQANAELLSNVKNLHYNIDSEIAYFKEARFKKTTPTFYDTKYYATFSENIFQEMHDSTASIFKFSPDLTRNRNTYFQLMALLIVMSLLFRKLSHILKDDLIRNPFLLALITTMLVGSFVIKRPADLYVILFWISLTGLLITLVKSLPGNHPERTDIIFLLILYMILQIVDTIGIPLPLYRGFLLFIAIGTSMYCSLRKKNYLKNLFYFSWTLQAFVFLFAMAAFAEFFGYHLMAVWLIQGTIKSAILIFAIWNLRYYLLGTISAITHLPFWQNIKFVQDYRYLIIKNTKAVFYFATVLLVTFALATIWGFYETFSQASDEILLLGITYHAYKFTLGMILQAGALFFAVQFVSFLVRQILETEIYPRNHITPGLGKSINSLITYFAWLIGVFLVFSSLGFDIRQLAIIAGALSVGIGFGLQNIINNFVSGLILLFERPIKVGDILEIGTEWGVVEKVGLRSTVIRSYSKAQIIIPNSDFITQKVVNLSLTDTDYRISIPISVAYGSDIELVKKVLFAIISKQEKIAKDPVPDILFKAFGTNSLDFAILAWTNDVGAKGSITSSILYDIDKEFRTHKIEIPFAQFDVHLRSVDADILGKISNK